eukprot:TRINITY_DN581_c0_g1_i4.p2 TRINITY_DN581_c0_g1~~TRINITY_DN581_c0_g1_i4.p2  ORF type:complete len:565 (+),score=120.86 TRINITY_DN581_c0_g1_i4:92-1696(+)
MCTDDHIVIIGAGPSGLHLAHLLIKNGFKNITVLEKSGRYGGKTLSVRHRSIEGVFHELGTCYMHPAYDEVRKLAQEIKEMGSRVDVTEELPSHGLKIYKIMSELPEYAKTMGSKGYMTFDEYILKSVENLELSPKWWWLPDVFQLKPLFDQICVYRELHESIFGKEYDALPPRLSEAQKTAINKSFGEFLRENKCEAIIPLCAYGLSAQGYGLVNYKEDEFPMMDQTPAFYGLLWITPKLLSRYVESYIPWGKHYPPKSMFKHGWERLWEELVYVDNLESRILLNCDVSRIVRDGDGVSVTYSRNDDVVTQRFNWLFLACPLNSAGSFVDYDDEEKDLFSALKSYTFRTTLFERSPEQRFAHLDFYVDRLFGSKTAGTGEAFSLRDTVLAYFNGSMHGTEHSRREQMCYQFDVESMEGMNADEAQKFRDGLALKAEAFLDEKVGQDHQILQDFCVSYFFHYPTEKILQEYPWRVWDRQGHRRTFYVHASVRFESVLDIVQYNTALVGKLLTQGAFAKQTINLVSEPDPMNSAA